MVSCYGCKNYDKFTYFDDPFFKCDFKYCKLSNHRLDLDYPYICEKYEKNFRHDSW